MRIHPVVNVSQIVQYKEQVEGQKKKEVKLVKVKEVEEWKVEKVLNKRKVRGVVKYLVQQKRFIAEYDTKEDLENTKKLVADFEERLNAEVKRQEKLDIAEERDFRRGELPEKYTVKMLYKQNNGKFENEYLEKNWQKWKSVFLEEKP